MDLNTRKQEERKTNKAEKAKHNTKKRRPNPLNEEDLGFLSSTEYEIESRKIQYGYHDRY